MFEACAGSRSDEPIQQIIEAMRAESQSVPAQVRGLTDLQGHAREKSGKEHVGRLGGIEVVLAALQSHRQAERVQELGCAVLMLLVIKCEKNAVKVFRSGGVAQVLGAMSAQPRNPKVQAKACSVLFFLPEEPEVDADIACHDGVDLVTAAMRQHPRVEEVQAHAVEVLTRLAGGNGDSLSRSRIVQSGGIELVLEALRAFPGSEELQEEGLGLLCCLAHRRDGSSEVPNPTAMAKIDAGQGLRLAQSAQQAHPGSKDLQNYVETLQGLDWKACKKKNDSCITC